MTGPVDIWTVLGIGPTADRRGIRSAYAAKLKSIDPEADPQAFIALREAMEQALANAPQSVVSFDLSDGKQIHPDDFDAIDVAGAARDLDRDLRTLARMLSDEAETDETDASLLAILQNIWRNPQADHLEHAFYVEDFITIIVAEHLPRADILVEPIVEKYGWKLSRVDKDEMNHGELVEAIISRLRDLRYLADIRKPGHSYHAAYLMVIQDPTCVPPEDRRRMKIAVGSLIATVRKWHSTIAWDLGEKRLLAWMDEVARLEPIPHRPGQAWTSTGRWPAPTFWPETVGTEGPAHGGLDRNRLWSVTPPEVRASSMSGNSNPNQSIQDAIDHAVHERFANRKIDHGNGRFDQTIWFKIGMISLVVASWVLAGHFADRPPTIASGTSR